MSEPIKVGDLVVVVGPGPCCNPLFSIGRVFQVFDEAFEWTYCGTCLKRLSDGERVLGDGAGCYYRPNRLKRIPPLSELDDVKRDEEITA